MKYLYRQLLFFTCTIFICELAPAQESIPLCILQKAKTTAVVNRKNPCQGGDQLKYIDCYAYGDTILYRFVFENKLPCPDYINHTTYFDSSCQVRIEIIDGGLKYRHIVLPAYIKMNELKFIKHIKTNIAASNKKYKNKKITL